MPLTVIRSGLSKCATAFVDRQHGAASAVAARVAAQPVKAMLDQRRLAEDLGNQADDVGLVGIRASHRRSRLSGG
jgi:hypothetical protein